MILISVHYLFSLRGAMAGRQSSPMWKCYHPPVTPAGAKVAKRKCRGCSHQVALCVVRAKIHADRCPGVRSLGLGIKEDITAHLTARSPSATHAAISRFFFANNIPFNVVQDRSFLRMLSTLSPCTRPPGRLQLAGPLLDLGAKKLMD